MLPSASLTSSSSQPLASVTIWRLGKRRSRWARRSSFDTAGDEALHDIALGEDEEDDHRDDHERRYGHQVVGSRDELALEPAEPKGERVVLGLRQVDERPQEVVPDPERREQRDRDHDRARQRDIDSPP